MWSVLSTLLGGQSFSHQCLSLSWMLSSVYEVYYVSMHTNVHSSTIYNSKDMKIIQVPLNRRLV